mgnify:CR=1 FL=1
MRNERRHILINPPFQLKFALLFTLAVMVYVSIFPIFVYTLLESMESHSLFSKSSAALNALREARSDMVLFFVVMSVVASLTAFLLALFHSHKIAGPLYKLRMSMVAMQQGVLNQHIKFRSKDNFMELADGFNAMTDSIFIRRRRDFERVNSVIPKLERLQRSLSGEDQASVTEVLNALQELSRELPMK